MAEPRHRIFRSTFLKRAAVVAAAALLTATGIWRHQLLLAAGSALTVDDRVTHADYLVVMGGSPEDRPFKAAALFRESVAPRVVLFEYPADARQRLGGSPSQTDVYRSVLELEGVPRSAIDVLPGVVRTSWDEAQSLRRFLATHAARRIVIVTSAEHTRRTRWAFEKALAATGVEVAVAAARREDFDETNWWQSDEGVLVYLHEYLKLPFYVLRYSGVLGE